MSVRPKQEAPVPRDEANNGGNLALDQKTVALRSAGKSYANIARTLGLADARKAHEAFSRDVRRRPSTERAALRDAEAVRLDTLADRTKSRSDLSAEQVAKRLRAIERLRQTVMMD
jgi:hypothetical protein